MDAHNTKTSAWRAKWGRLRAMSTNEVRTRIAQEANKRVDYLAYLAGNKFGRSITGRVHRPESRFFFMPDEVSSRVDLLNHWLPSEANAIVGEAKNICEHRFNLLGFSDLDLGPEIDWHLDPVHVRHAPFKPWYKIDFLDFESIGDHKVIWELSRHQHLVTLAKAWRITSDYNYLSELMSQWHSWQRANPYPIGINWASALEVAFRSLSWIWVLQITSSDSKVAKTFCEEIIAALAVNARHIERYLSTYFSPNTHLLGEAVALFFIGVLCPQLSRAAEWRELGRKTVLNEAKRQVRSDGIYFEQSLYYHVYALDFFLHFRLLSELNGVSIPYDFDEVIRKMLSVLSTLASVGAPEGFGDDDGGRVFNPRRNQPEHMTDPLAIGVLLFGADELPTRAALTEESIWLFGNAAVERSMCSSPAAAPASTSFTSGGIYVIGESQPYPQQMAIDAGPQGSGRCGHEHADALSIRFGCEGERILVDSGTCAYLPESERNLFRGTGAHNTVRVDGLDQALPDGPFAWISVPGTRVERWFLNEEFSLFVGSHNGYARLSDPVFHRRLIFHPRAGGWWIHDLLAGAHEHDLEIFWHFAANMNVAEKRDGSFVATNSDDELAIFLAEKSGWQKQLTQGQISPAYGMRVEAPALRVSAKVQLPAECLTLFLPRKSMEPAPGTLRRIETSSAGDVWGYQFANNFSQNYLFCSSEKLVWSSGNWSSDAELLFCELLNGSLSRFVLVGGSFARWQDHVMVTLNTTVEHFTWRRSLSGIVTSCSDERAISDVLSRAMDCEPGMPSETVHPVQ